ncbi:kelch-like protein 25 [Arctopsyche grandis]|uniref:kelch-like protein 25 n=1 Tax=Arctopsyche grandis TaxID=121162 RepID=UPI00406D9EB7
MTKTWSFSTPMTIGREACGIAVLDNEIYIIGGWSKELDEETGVKTVEAYCPLSGKWKTCAPMNEIRLWISATTHGNKIYVLGGRKKMSPVSHRYNSVECYNKHTDSWSFIADISNSRYGVASGILGIDLVFVGGADLANWNFNAVEKYNANLNRWTSLAPVHEKRENSYVFSVPISWLERKITLN